MSETTMLSDEQFGKMLGELSARLAPVVEERTRQAVKDLGLTRVDRKHAMFPGVAEDGAEPARERSFRFFRAVLGGDFLSMKDLSGGTGSAGGYLVPDGFREEIVARLPELSELAPYVRVVPVSTDAGTLPSLSTDVAITWSGVGSSSENQAFNATDPVLGQVAWQLKRADAITKMSRELVADSQPSIVEFVTRLFREAIAAERDRAIAVGNGSTEPYGLYSAAGISSVAVGGSITFAKLVEIEQTLKRPYRTRARWILNGTNLRRVRSLVDEQSRPLFVRDLVGGTPESRILGYPVSQQDNLPDDLVFFGDLSYYLWFDRGEMGIESTIFGGDAFEKHQTWVKVWERADGKVGLTEAFVKGSGITG